MSGGRIEGCAAAEYAIGISEIRENVFLQSELKELFRYGAVCREWREHTTKLWVQTLTNSMTTRAFKEKVLSKTSENYKKSLSEEIKELLKGIKVEKTIDLMGAQFTLDAAEDKAKEMLNLSEKIQALFKIIIANIKIASSIQNSDGYFCPPPHKKIKAETEAEFEEGWTNEEDVLASARERLKNVNRLISQICDPDVKNTYIKQLGEVTLLMDPQNAAKTLEEHTGESQDRMDELLEYDKDQLRLKYVKHFARTEPESVETVIQKIECQNIQTMAYIKVAEIHMNNDPIKRQEALKKAKEAAQNIAFSDIKEVRLSEILILENIHKAVEKALALEAGPYKDRMLYQIIKTRLAFY